MSTKLVVSRSEYLASAIAERVLQRAIRKLREAADRLPPDRWQDIRRLHQVASDIGDRSMHERLVRETWVVGVDETQNSLALPQRRGGHPHDPSLHPRGALMNFNNDFERGAWAMVSWIYHTSGERFATLVYGADSHPSYLAEKAGLWAESPTRALGYLDEPHLQRVMALVKGHAAEVNL